MINKYLYNTNKFNIWTNKHMLKTILGLVYRFQQKIGNETYTNRLYTMNDLECFNRALTLSTALLILVIAICNWEFTLFGNAMELSFWYEIYSLFSVRTFSVPHLIRSHLLDYRIFLVQNQGKHCCENYYGWHNMRCNDATSCNLF